MLLVIGVETLAQSSYTVDAGSVKIYRIDKQTNIVDYQWEIFDNSNLTSSAAPTNATLNSLGAGRENEIEVHWKVSGSYYLLISVLDNATCTNRMAWHFNVVDSSNKQPITMPDFVTIYEDSDPVYINVLKNDSDPDGGHLTASIISGSISGAQVSVVNQDSILYTPALNFFGDDFIVYRACDNQEPSLCTSDTIHITILPVNDAPVANNDPVAFFVNSSGNIIDVLLNDINYDDDQLTVTISKNPTSGATVTVGGDGKLTYNAATGFVGEDVFEYTVCDDGTPQLCASALVIVTVTDKLLAVNDNYAVNSGAVLLAPVLANDFFVQAVQVTLLTQPQHGTTTVATDGTIQYTPDANFIGTETIQYQIENSSGSSTGILTITVNPVVYLAASESCVGGHPYINWSVQVAGIANPVFDLIVVDSNGQEVASNSTSTLSGTMLWPGVDINQVATLPSVNLQQLTLKARFNTTPSAVAVSNLLAVPTCALNTVVAVVDHAVSYNEGVRIDVLKNDFDPEEHLILASTVKIATDQGPKNGTAKVLFDGSISYTPHWGYQGKDSLIYSVCDNGVPTACDTAIVRLDVFFIDQLTVANDFAFTYANNDAFINVIENDGPKDKMDLASLKLKDDPENGNVFVDNGLFHYIPNNDFVGIDSFSYELCDVSATPVCKSAWVYVNVTLNEQIVARPDLVETVVNGSLLIDVLANDYDLDGEIDPARMVIKNQPLHGTINIQNGVIEYVPNNNFAGMDSIIYELCDAGKPITCDTAVVRIEVINTNENILAVYDLIDVSEGQSEILDVLKNDIDPEGKIDLSSLVILEQPNGTAVVNADGTITYTPVSGFNGLDTFVYQICDGTPIVSCDTARVVLNVQDNRPPVAYNDNIIGYAFIDNMLSFESNDNDPEGKLDMASIQIISNVQHGTLIYDTVLKTWVYRATDCYLGTDSFTYTISDMKGNVSNVATVTLTVDVSSVHDADGDGISDLAEALGTGNPCLVDTDQDGTPNYLDTDDDGDGVLTANEDLNGNKNGFDDDTDGDGTPNYLDNDDDGDTVLTIYEDIDNNGVWTNDDTDQDGIPNYLDSDDDGDGIPTAQELNDLDGNGVPDFLENWKSRAVNDELISGIDAAVVIPVLANDSSQMDPSTLRILDNPSSGYVVINSNDNTITYYPNYEFEGIDSFTYVVCDYYYTCDSATVLVQIEDRITPPEIFTPNGDLSNQFYVIKGLERYPDCRFEIWNRWGQKVYSKRGYQNDFDGVSNVSGRFGNKPLPVGIYYYVLNYAKNKEKQGAFYLER